MRGLVAVINLTEISLLNSALIKLTISSYVFVGTGLLTKLRTFSCKNAA